MPFNSHRYYRNKYRRQAQEYMSAARASGNVEHYVRLARLSWKSYLSYRSLCECDADLKRFQRGEITYAEFMNKWDIRKGQTK